MKYAKYTAPEGRFSIHDKLGDVMAKPQGEKFVQTVLEEAEKYLTERGKSMPKISPAMMRMASGMKIKRIISMLGNSVPEDMIARLNDELNKIEK